MWSRSWNLTENGEEAEARMPRFCLWTWKQPIWNGEHSGWMGVCTGSRRRIQEWNAKEAEMQTQCPALPTDHGRRARTQPGPSQGGLDGYFLLVFALICTLLLSVLIPAFCNPGRRGRHMASFSKTAKGYSIRQEVGVLPAHSRPWEMLSLGSLLAFVGPGERKRLKGHIPKV